MSIPNLQVNVEPLQSGRVVYLPIAPGSSKGKAGGRILLQFAFVNGEPKPITVTKVVVTFPGATTPPGPGTARALNVGSSRGSS
jgi:hypothetical protein